MWVSCHLVLTCLVQCSCAIVPSCVFVGPNFFLVGTSWVINLFSWVFRRSKIVARGYFVGVNVFFVVILWVQNFFSWLFRGSEFFSRGYFVGPKLLFMSILWVPNFLSLDFGVPIFFLEDISWVHFFFSWLISWFEDFQLLTAWERVAENRNPEIHLKHVFFSKSISTIVNYLR